jgi:hypothetical protein
MLILLTTFLFIFTPFAMMILHLIRPKFSIQGFLVAIAVLVGWPMVFLARSDIPLTISLLQWKPESLFPISPSLLIDDISWYFALALASLALSVVITSIAQIGQSSKTDQLQAQTKIQVTEDQNNPEEGISSSEPTTLIDAGSTPNWQLWASILALTSLGLVAVTAGNILTLLLAWAALDIIELIILLGQMHQSKIRERIILAFSAKMAGIVTVFIAGIILWSHGASLSFDVTSKSVSTYLVLAVGLRLGVLPLHLPFTQGLPIRRGLGTVLRLVPAASSYILLVRVSNVGITDAVTPYLLVLTVLAGLFAAVNWLGAKNELNGRPYWLLGTASLAVAAAILNHPGACLAWSITSLLSGGLIFSMSIRHRNLIPLVILGLINLSALPFSPTWQGVTIYQYSSSSPVNLTLFSLLSLFYLLIQSFLLAGFIRHALRGIYPVGKEISDHIERWVWFLYPIGLIFIVATHLLIGWWLHQNIYDVTLIGWIIGPVSLILTGLILYIAWRFPHPFPLVSRSTKTSFWNNLFSLVWFYRLLWNIFRTSSKVFALFSTLLEGDGGILWALVLFGLIFVFLQR